MWNHEDVEEARGVVDGYRRADAQNVGDAYAQ
jgi:hypothetical protein